MLARMLRPFGLEAVTGWPAVYVCLRLMPPMRSHVVAVLMGPRQRWHSPSAESTAQSETHYWCLPILKLRITPH